VPYKKGTKDSINFSLYLCFVHFSWLLKLVVVANGQKKFFFFFNINIAIFKSCYNTFGPFPAVVFCIVLCVFILTNSLQIIVASGKKLLQERSLLPSPLFTS
jgi:hypothetical protein